MRRFIWSRCSGRARETARINRAGKKKESARNISGSAYPPIRAIRPIRVRCRFFFSSSVDETLSRARIKRFKDSALNPPLVRDVYQRDKYPPHKYYFLSRDGDRGSEQERIAPARVRRGGILSSLRFLFTSIPSPPRLGTGRRRKGSRARASSSRRIWKNRMRSRRRRVKDSFLP